MSRECAKCRFWLNEDKEVSGLGECHRYPPVMATRRRAFPMPNSPGDFVVDTERPQDGGWPYTFPEDWCGEFQER